MILNRFYITGLLIILALVIPAYAQNGVLNLSSSRHYQTDEALNNNFIKQSGIRLNRIEAGEDPLIEGLRNEGAASPADVLVTVDAGRLWRAKQMGLIQPIDSKLLKARIPAHLIAFANQWFSFSTRARVIVYNKTLLNANGIKSYEDPANPRLKGKLCVRLGGHVYNLSLMSALIEHCDEAKAKAWACAVVANFARAPNGRRHGSDPQCRHARMHRGTVQHLLLCPHRRLRQA